MQLLDLPDETLLQIWDAVLPTDFDAVLLTCQKAHRLATAGKLPRHRQLKSKYAKCAILGTERHPGAVLHAIWLDPHLAHYIRNVHYVNNDHFARGGARDYSYVGSDTLDLIQECSTTLLAESDRVCGQPWLLDIDRELLLQGDETSAFWLLLSLLPNLSNLAVQNCSWDYDRVNNIHSHQFLPSTTLNHTFRPLSKLHSVTVETGTNSLPIGRFERVAVWALSPRIKLLKARGACVVEGEYPFELSWPGADDCFRSSLETLHLDHGLVDPTSGSGFDRFLQPLTNLKEFRYHHMNYSGGDPENSKFRAGTLVEVLAKICGERLQTLSVTSEADTVDAITNFRDFKVLKDLEFQASHLVASEDDDDQEDMAPPHVFVRILSRSPLVTETIDNPFSPGSQDHSPHSSPGKEYNVAAPMPSLVDILPPLLQTLTISLEDIENDESTQLFGGWAARKADRLPGLGRMSYARAEKVPDQVKEDIKGDGVRLFHRDRFVPKLHEVKASRHIAI